MRTSRRRHLSHASLLLLLAADLLALAALVVDQWLAPGIVATWVVAAVVTVALMPALLWLVDRVFAMARASRDVAFSGGTFP